MNNSKDFQGRTTVFPKSWRWLIVTELQPYSHVFGFDPHFKIFHELMAFKVREILLVSSPYDAYIMEEDGSLASRIINEYFGLNLSQPPRITRVATGEEALELLGERDFDLVVTMPHLGGMDGCAFSTRVKNRHKKIPVVLLSHSAREAVVDIDDIQFSCIDNTYVWNWDSGILLAIVKSVEDQLNVDRDTEKAMVRVILLVEDSAVYRSRLLPLLYGELVQQTQSVLGEGLNEQHRILKMRARPKILTVATYEEAIELYKKYQPYIFAVMSDARFPKAGQLQDDAGFTLLEYIRSKASDLPLLMLSTDSSNREQAEEIPAVFVDKNSPDINEQVHDFFLRYLGFGDFVFHLPDQTQVGRAANLHEFEQLLKNIPITSIRYHAANNHFSNWVMARAEIALAARLHKDHFAAIKGDEDLREDILLKVHALRKLRQQGVVAQYDSTRFDPRITDFVRIGKGSMGGKARGIAFITSQFQLAERQGAVLKDHHVRIPQTCVIANTGFDDFISHNDLHRQDDEDDQSVARRFLDGKLPDWLEEDLRSYLATIEFPVSIRSSSMLEDARFRPYAGLYNTFMLPNNHPSFEVRFHQLASSIKLVYASTWFAGPRAFSRSVGQSQGDSMAVIIQQLVGRFQGDYFYPAISGVVQSYNYYPVGNMLAEEGIAHLALGFGKSVVEGERSLRFSPAYPQYMPQFSTVEDILKNAQRYFYALDCSRAKRFSQQASNLVAREMSEAVTEYPVRLLCSTYIPQEDRIRDGDFPGHKVLTFAPILKYGVYKLPKILSEIMIMGREGMGCEVEIEFAVDLAEDPSRSVFYFLQIRPIAVGGEQGQVRIHVGDREDAFLRSIRSLGHGVFSEIADIVFVKPDSFDRGVTREIAAEIGRINSLLQKKGRSYLLVGQGRWGTADPWLGIPVQWHDISGVGAIVELQDSNVNVEPSQGSHFFQNITSLGIPYLMVYNSHVSEAERDDQSEYIDWSVLQAQEVVTEGTYTKHVACSEPFTLKVDGKTSEAIGLFD